MQKAIMTIMQPLVRLLLRHGISISEFSEIARRAFVEVAYRDFALPSRKPSIARVAVVTGLHRKEVVRLSAPAGAVAEAEPGKTKSNRAQRVINGWLTDSRFLDRAGKPRVLSLKKGRGSFHELVKKYSGDITGRAVLDELIRVGVAEKPDKRTVRLNAQGFVPFSDDAEKVEIAASHVSDLLDTVNFNLGCAPADARFQRQVTYYDVPIDVIEEFRQISREKSNLLIGELNRWLAEKKAAASTQKRARRGKVGTGIYYLENINEGDEK